MAASTEHSQQPSDRPDHNSTSVSISSSEAATLLSSSVINGDRKLLPFSGTAALSDGSTVQLYSWLQRQLALLGSDKSTASSEPSSESPENVVNRVVSVKSQLMAERALKISSLVDKRGGVFTWQNSTSSSV